MATCISPEVIIKVHLSVPLYVAGIMEFCSALFSTLTTLPYLDLVLVHYSAAVFVMLLSCTGGGCGSKLLRSSGWYFPRQLQGHHKCYIHTSKPPKSSRECFKPFSFLFCSGFQVLIFNLVLLSYHDEQKLNQGYCMVLLHLSLKIL